MSSHATDRPTAGSVGVVIPCHNYGRFLPTCLDSVLSQPGVNLDVLVIDDASSDDSRSVAESYACRDDRVKVISHRVNAGHIATYNEGLATVQGDFLVLLSADDALAPRSLVRAASILAARPNVGFTYGRVQTFSTEIPPPPRMPQLKTTTVWPGHSWLKRRSQLMTNCVVSPEVVMRRTVYEKAGPYDPALPHTGDLAMWMRAAAITDVAYLHGPPAAYYRQHTTNMHRHVFRSGTPDGMLLDLAQRRQTLEAVFASESDDNSRVLMNSGLRTLAAEALSAASRAFTWGFTDEWPVEGLERFAAECWPGYRTLPQFRALDRRRKRGAELALRYPPYVATERALELRRNWVKLRQEWTGR
ncbi:glycosyltransferase [Pseudarthrobacter phenanthrenivorans]|uniref:glycosyltransferase n=1 Tax=Pseudarthrobacter phenanthrenivorans TaxID=361575 RepID=UPI0015E8393E